MTGAAPGNDAPGAPRPGSLEWLADHDGDAPAIVDTLGDRALNRREFDTEACALARGLAAEHAIRTGDRVGVRLAAGPELLVVTYALAKLGAAPVVLPPAGPGVPPDLAATAGCALVVSDGAPAAPATGPPVLPAAGLPALRSRHATGARLLSQAQPVPDGVQCTDPAAGPVRLVVRLRTPERVARLGPAVGDLLTRVALPPATTYLLGPRAHRPEPQFWASMTLLTGGTVVTHRSADPSALLRTLGEQAVGAIVLGPEDLRALLELPQADRDEADLLALQWVLCDGPGLDAEVVAGWADLAGEDVLQLLLSSTQTGPYAHADAAALQDASAGTPAALAGVEVTAGSDGGTLVRSPLAADGALGDAAQRGGWPPPPGWRDGRLPASPG